jgi:SAM-dependent methyltransferase
VSTVIWHDLECGSYTADLPLWHELAALTGGPILDVGAGTGRVSLALARIAHEVVALDVDAELLAELTERASGLPVRTVVGDARDFALDQRFPLILAPMQTVQLLGSGYEDFVRCAAAHLEPDGILAVALAHPPAYEGDVQPLPDMREQDGWIWSSQPVAIRPVAGGMAIVRVRETVAPDGARTVADDEVVLSLVTAAEIEALAPRYGLRVLPRCQIEETDDYVGSEVVLLGA